MCTAPPGTMNPLCIYSNVTRRPEKDLRDSNQKDGEEMLKWMLLLNVTQRVNKVQFTILAQMSRRRSSAAWKVFS